jgi:GMP synthase (glutamine-hydrolysing)
MNKILIVDMCYEANSLHYNEFVIPVENIIKENNNKYGIIHFKQLNNNLVNNYSKIILCGVALKDFEYLNHIELFNWIKNYNGYLLGICAGAQIIGKIFESKIKEGCEIGLINVKKVEEDKILENVSLNEIYALHNSYVEVPIGFKLILETTYPQLFTNGNIYASLFHPEIRNKNLIKNFILF